MRPFLLAAGILEKQVGLSIKKPHIKTTLNAFDWLHKLYMTPEYAQMVYARGLRSEDTWRRYELFEVEGLQEQEIHEDAAKALAKLWRKKRPRLFGKLRKVKTDEEN